jgi:dihydroneopterin triphosphate diphosphatase
VTDIKVGVVDVYVMRPYGVIWKVLALQRAEGTRCATSWETVHGHIEGNERPEEAAVREVREETGLEIDRLYNVTVQPFYLHGMKAVQVAVVFACFVREPGIVRLGPEHQRAEWLPVESALRRFAWPREREALNHVVTLLHGGSAGPLEDVLRVY